MQTNQTFKSFYIGMNTCRICWKEIWKTYSDKKLRCSSCRKSVENAIWYNERTVEYVEDELFAWKSEYKKLKKEKENLKAELQAKQKVIQYYRKEKKKLNEKIRFLEECLDRKEKVNKSLREELEKLKSTYVYDAKQVRDIC